jgi:tRNA A-37 threonylcarbamoyl transferase component Bud32
MKIEAPRGFTLYSHGEYSIVLRDDLHHRCCDLVADLAKKPAPERGKVVIAPFSDSDGQTILAAFRRTVRGGPYSRFGLESTLGFIPRTLSEVTVAVAAERLGAPLATPLGCYWKWGAARMFYTGGYFSLYQEKGSCLSEVLKGWIVTRPSKIQRRQILTQLARALTQLHLAGIVHTDLTLNNILFGPDHRCVFVDFDGAYTVKSIPDRSLKAEVSRLNRSLEKSGMGGLVPLRERLWFLKKYLGSLRHNKILVRQILVRAAHDLRWHRLFWSRKNKML